MGQCIIMTSGYAGDSSDDCTASKSQVLEGYTAITKDSDAEAVMGTMPNRGIGGHAVNSGINDKGLWYYISPGYYPASASDSGNCWVYRTQAEVAATAGLTANKLMKNQSVLGISGTATSDANATANHILSGKTAYVNGNKITGNLTIQSVVSFNVAQYSNLTIIASWANPSKGPWSGLRIVCKQGSYPSSVSDGTLFYEGSGTSATKSLAAGTWYFRSWNYITTNTGRLYGGYHDKSISNQAIKGTQIFTSSGTFTVPSLIREIQVFLVGAGGSGNYRVLPSGSTYYGGGGGGGGYTRTYKIPVTPGQSFAVTIGAPTNLYYGDGGTTYFGAYSAPGGHAHGKELATGSDGGSGGGAGSKYIGGVGGTDGGSGGQANGIVGGIGQGSTTRAFSESTGTLYASGGNGGDRNGRGAGGGVNTGNGGGGMGQSSSSSYGQAGSGICIVRWGY